MDGGLAPDAVGEWAEQHLTESEPEKQGRDDELDIVRARCPEVAPDHRQRR